MLKVGDIVKLNKHGMVMIGGLRSHDEIEQARRMTVTEVVPIGDGFSSVQVDKVLINQFMLMDDFFDVLDC